MKDVARRWVPG